MYKIFFYVNNNEMQYYEIRQHQEMFSEKGGELI